MSQKVLVKEPVPYWIGREAQQRLEEKHRDEGERELATQSRAVETTEQYMTPATNDASGKVVEMKRAVAQQFAEPVPYWALDALSTDEVKALEKERDELSAALPRMRKGERSSTETRIRIIERALKANRALEEDERRSAERREERPRERYGSQTGSQTATANTKGGKLTWAGLFKNLDDKVANTCCVGEHKCADCRAKEGT